MSETVDKIISRLAELKNQRQPWEAEWREIADYCLPSASRQMALSGLGGAMSALAEGPATRDASRKRYDSTPLWALDRLTSGTLSLITPDSEKWHGLEDDDPFGADPTDDEKQWYERLRDYLFAARYDTRSGFALANQKAIRSTLAFGTGVLFSEEGIGQNGSDPKVVPFLYKHIPLSQCFIGVNSQGETDTLFRVYSQTARQLVEKFTLEKVSQNVKNAYERNKDQKFEIIHAVFPRAEMPMGGSRSVKNAAFTDYVIEAGSKTILRDKGYYQFPYIVYHWLQNDDSGYAESPVMLAMDDIRGLNVTKKTAARAMQQWAAPPMAVAHDGVMNRPNLNPNAINMGAVDSNGRLKIQPIVTAQNPGAVQQIIDNERLQVTKSLYVDLFQILQQNPNMTATEAMIRAGEKGEMLGPAGTKIQAALAKAVDREIAIIELKGAFVPGSVLAPPQSLAGRAFKVKFTGPLDRLRLAQEVLGTERTLQTIVPVLQNRQALEAEFDIGAIIDVVRSGNGAPAKILLSGAKKQEMQAQQQQMMQQQAGMMMAQQGADAANKAASAVKNATATPDAMEAIRGLVGAQ